MDNGWIKLYRKSLESEVFKDADLWHLWCRLLAMASYDKKRVVIGSQVVELNPGQCIVGRKMLAKLEKRGEQKIRNLLKMLEELQMISVKTTNRFTLVTIEKWGFYQGDDRENNQQTTNKQPTDNQQTTTNKKYKENKEIKNIYNFADIEKNLLSNYREEKK